MCTIIDKPSLPEYEVVIHTQCNVFGKKLVDQILSATALYELVDCAAHQGHNDFHWSFKTWEEAVSAGDALKGYCQNPNLILLRVQANNKSDQKPIVHKDLILPAWAPVCEISAP